MLRRFINLFRQKRIVYIKDVARPYNICLKQKDRFKGQVAFVTGGSGAIGRAICIRLASEGAIVYVGGTRLETISGIIEEIKQLGFIAKPLQINLLDEKSIINGFEEIKKEEGRLDLFVDCAGGGARDQMRPLIEQTSDIISKIINLNLVGGIISAREAAKIMKPQNSGKIIFISSTVGVRGLKNYSEYAAAKAGIISFATSIAMEMGQYGINVNCITPGIVQRGTIDDLQLEQIKQTNWLQDYGKPEDISSMVAYLNSEEASFITGQNFIIDGGRSLGLKNSK